MHTRASTLVITRLLTYREYIVPVLVLLQFRVPAVQQSFALHLQKQHNQNHLMSLSRDLKVTMPRRLPFYTYSKSVLSKEVVILVMYVLYSTLRLATGTRTSGARETSRRC